MTEIYLLFWAASLIIVSLLTIFIIRYRDILAWYKRKFVKPSTRSIVYEVIKELQTQHKRYIRQQVRAYLKELQNGPVQKKVYKVKTKLVSNDKANSKDKS